jgi:hypothetical protein
VAGFEVTETLAGRLRLVRDGVERPIAVTIRSRSGPIASFLRRPLLAIEGAVEAPGFADHQLFTGSIDAGGVFAERRLVYAFTFRGDDGQAYDFAGEKAFVTRDLVASLTLLVGAIRDAGGALVGEALLRFDLRSDLVRCAKSFRAAR